MKKSLNRVKKIYLNRIIAFIIMELFFISIVPVNADNVNNFKDKFSKNEKRNVPLKISYSFDIDKDILYLSWNKNLNSGKKYYVFKKDRYEGNFELITSKEGIKENYFITSL